MSGAAVSPYHSLDEARAANAELDAALGAQVERMTSVEKGIWPAPTSASEEWDAAEVLAHLAEFPTFFASELTRWHGDHDVPVGRDHTDADRLAAIHRARNVPVQELANDAVRASSLLADALRLLGDADVEASTQNRKYGTEPLRSFLDRYVLGHKASHVQQLTEAVDADLARQQATTPLKGGEQ